MMFDKISKIKLKSQQNTVIVEKSK